MRGKERTETREGRGENTRNKVASLLDWTTQKK